MLKKVTLTEQVRARELLKFLSPTQEKGLLRYARFLKGKKVVHVSATGKGGGVAELLQSFIPYLQALGIEASWYTIDPTKTDKAFFDFTNRLHNVLQGSLRKFSKEEWDRFAKVNKEIAQDIQSIEHDILVVHDPQPLGTASFLKKKNPTIAVFHIDTSSPDPVAWKTILGLAKQYDKIVFSNEDFVNKTLPKGKVHVIPPAIDPLALKQTVIPQRRARTYLLQYGIPAQGPLIVQVSRFDVWKNPYGLLEAFWLLEKKQKTALLMLVGFQEARDNPEAEKVYMDIRGMAGKDPRIFLLFSPRAIGGASNIREFTTMVQNAADIVVQNSIKEGFGLTVAEAMWKAKPVVGGPGAGIRRQIRHGENGYIARNTLELVEYLDYLLANPAEQKRVGKAGKESVRKNFLMPRFVLDHLIIYYDLLR